MFEDRTTENLKKETLAEIEPATGVSSMAGSYADATVGPLCQAVSRLYKALPGCCPCCSWTRAAGASWTWWGATTST